VSPIEPGAEDVIRVALSRNDVEEVLQLVGRAVTPELPSAPELIGSPRHPWGVCFALAVGDAGQRSLSGSTGLLGSVAVPLHRLRAAWDLSRPDDPVLPNWLPLILGLLAGVVMVLLLWRCYVWATFRAAAWDLADVRVAEADKSRAEAGAKAAASARAGWQDNPGSIPPEHMPRQPTSAMLEEEAARIAVGDKTMLRKVRVPAKALDSGVIFDSAGRITGSVDAMGAVRDLDGNRVGTVSDPPPRRRGEAADT